MRIGILGTRGIPNFYGGFEQITESLAPALQGRGHEVTVYNSHQHPYPKKSFKGVRIVHRLDPEKWIGTAGQFIYDLLCILHARRQDYDLIIFMGYTSSSIWHFLFPRIPVISNMDGMEWKRSKYSARVQRFLRYAEKLAVKHSTHHIADSMEIRTYLNKEYGIDARFIPYAADIPTIERPWIFEKYKLQPGDYYMLMCRMEPENNPELILDGYLASGDSRPFVVVGSMETSLGQRLQKKYTGINRVILMGSLFNQHLIHTLRKHARLYFHGHSVGGTNPSLLEAMSSGALIAAHDNVFNREVLESNAYFFQTTEEVKKLIQDPQLQKEQWATNNFKKLADCYHWEQIVTDYESLMHEAIQPQAVPKHGYEGQFQY